MANKKKGILICLGVGLAMILISIIIIMVAVMLPKYTATITEIKSSYSTVDEDANREYKEKVSLNFTDSNGREITDDSVLIKRDHPEELPSAGENVTIVYFLFGAYEYGLITPIAWTVVLFFLGLFFMIAGPIIVSKQYKKFDPLDQ